MLDAERESRRHGQEWLCHYPLSSAARSDDVNVIYVTISATGDTHSGARSQFTALLNDSACNPGPNPVGGALPGWVTLQRHKNYNLNYVITALFAGDGGGGAGDLHDNSITYTWCCRKAPSEGLQNVKVKMASGNVDGAADPRVFVEGVHFYIDGSQVRGADACVADTTPLPEGGSFP